MPAFVYAVLAVSKSRKNLPKTLECISRIHLVRSPRKARLEAERDWTSHRPITLKQVIAKNSVPPTLNMGCDS